MRAVRETTSIDRVLDGYAELFHALAALGARRASVRA
jgi:hypothetical protein